MLLGVDGTSLMAVCENLTWWSRLNRKHCADWIGDVDRHRPLMQGNGQYYIIAAYWYCIHSKQISAVYWASQLSWYEIHYFHHFNFCITCSEFIQIDMESMPDLPKDALVLQSPHLRPHPMAAFPADHAPALAHQTRPSLTSSFHRALTKHVLAGSTSAQPLLRPHHHSSVLTSSAHPCAQASSKCCSGCSPSPHLCLVPVLGPYYN
jgi:hypothetical protein